MAKNGATRIATPRRLFTLSMGLIVGFLLAGCASGDFSKSSGGSPTPPGSGYTAPPNPPSLPPLAAPTSANTYVGTQIPGANQSTTQENLIALTINQTSLSYAYHNIEIPGTTTNPMGSYSQGNVLTWYDYWDMGDTTGDTGTFGLAPFGLTVEEPSRYAFFVASANNPTDGTGPQPIAALVPQQTSGCITPKAAATYSFVTLFGASFAPATDSAYGTVRVSASGSSFQFAGARQYVLPAGAGAAAATTGLIPFSAGACTSSPSYPELGYFIDTPASSATQNIEMRTLLGPTGILISNLQNAKHDPLPGVLSMIQPSSPIDLAKVEANSDTYRVLLYQPQNDSAAGFVTTQYGYAEHQGDGALVGQNTAFDPVSTATPDLLVVGLQAPTSVAAPGSGFTPAIALHVGQQDGNNAGLFPAAEFVNVVTSTTTCPAGTTFFHTANTTTPGVACASPAVAMVGQHDGKYVIVAVGDIPDDFASTTGNNGPTLLILVQN